MKVDTQTTVRVNGEVLLSVKELAQALGRGPHYVYQMRARGFTMRKQWPCPIHVATLREAMEWQRRHQFRLVDGRGVIKES